MRRGAQSHYRRSLPATSNESSTREDILLVQLALKDGTCHPCVLLEGTDLNVKTQIKAEFEGLNTEKLRRAPEGLTEVLMA